jgi:hypothetical protein
MLYLISIERPDEAQPIVRIVDMYTDDATEISQRLERCTGLGNARRTVFAYTVKPFYEDMIDLHQFIDDDLEPLEQDLPA